jgi:hypothetical protein
LIQRKKRSKTASALASGVDPVPEIRWLLSQEINWLQSRKFCIKEIPMKKTLCLAVLVASITIVIATKPSLAAETHANLLSRESGPGVGTLESVGQNLENKVIGYGSATDTVGSCSVDQWVVQDAEAAADQDSTRQCPSGQVSRITDYQTSTFDCRKIPWDLLLSADAQATYLCIQ